MEKEEKEEKEGIQEKEEKRGVEEIREIQVKKDAQDP
jgi:hypothetical protein